MRRSLTHRHFSEAAGRHLPHPCGPGARHNAAGSPAGMWRGPGGTPGHWGFGDRLPPAPPHPLPAGLSPLPAPAAQRVGRDRVLPGRPWAAEQAAGWDVFALERPGFAGGGWQRRGGGCWEPQSCVPAASSRPAAWGIGEVGELWGWRDPHHHHPPQGRKGLLWVLREAPGAGLGVGLGLSGFSQRRRGVRQGAQAGVSQMQPRGRLGRPLTSGGPQEARGAPRGLSEPLLCWGGRGNGMERGRWWCWDQEGGGSACPLLVGTLRADPVPWGPPWGRGGFGGQAGAAVADGWGQCSGVGAAGPVCSILNPP